MKNKLTVGAFLLMLLTFSVILLLPADKESIEAENRTMATIPPVTEETIFSGSFASGFESFVGDNISNRSFFTQLSKKIESLKGIIPDTGKVISANKDIGTGTTQKQTLLVVDNTIMEMFIRNEEQEANYAKAVNTFAQNLPENIKIFSMIIPTQLEFREPMYKNLQDSQESAIKSIDEKLDTRITPVDAYGILADHSDEYIYFRTDHHWTQLGAYYDYLQFMITEGGNAVNKEDFEKNKINGVLGYLYDQSDVPEIASNPDTIEWYDIDPQSHITTTMYNTDANGEFYQYNGTMYDRTKANYQFFFSSDHPVVEMVNNDIPDGKTIVVVKDSYTNVFAPWLIKSYGKVILVDPRIYTEKFSKITERYDVDEVLVANYIFTTNFNDYCVLLENLF